LYGYLLNLKKILKMRSLINPSRLFLVISLVIPFAVGFAPVVETKTLPYAKEQIGLLKAGKVTTEVYTAKPHDNYYIIARKYGLGSRYLMSLNKAKSPYLNINDKVTISRVIIPASSHDGLIINLPEKKLYHFTKGRLLKTYGVAVGKPSTETPMGNYSILYKTEAPEWHVPLSIQKEMAASGKEVKTVVPPGPGNPLGNWWMAIGNGIGIHSTNAPASIGYSVSHGCIRMRPRSAQELFKKVKVKTPVKIIYQPLKIGVDKENRVYLEVYPDMYSRNINYTEATRYLLKQSNLDANIDWNSVSLAIRSGQGVPYLISKGTPVVQPTETPAVKLTPLPVISPSAKPTPVPSPTAEPTSVPLPTAIPSVYVPTPVPPEPTLNPTAIPYPEPTEKPIDIIVKPRPTPARVSPSVTPTPFFLDNTHPR
jgi:L,D-transpeptidase ErfK/SrfK